MSDFLSSLAARSLNLAPVIQPRPVSLFEATPVRSTLDPAPVLEEISIAAPALPGPIERPETNRTHATPAASQPQAVEAIPPPLVELAQPRAAPPERPGLVLQPAPDPGQPMPGPQTRQHEPRRAAAPALPSQPLSEPAYTDSYSSAQPHRHHEAPDTAPAIVAQEQPAQVLPSIEPTDVYLSRENSPRPTVTPIIERIVHEVQADQAQPRTGAATHRAHAQQLVGIEHQAAQPAIQVTIGRIEIRATPPATPARRAPNPAPTLSLDDYLRSRQGGRR